MTDSSTTTYNTNPSATSQIGGLLATGAGAYLAGKGTKEGGVIRDKGYATGGIVAFNIGGAIEAKFQDMTPAQIEKTLSEATSEQEKKIGNRVLAEKRMARGGIVGYKKEGEVKEKKKTTTDIEYSANQKRLKEELDIQKAAEEEALLLAENNPQPAPAEVIPPPMDAAATPAPAVAPPMDAAPVAQKPAPVTTESATAEYQKAIAAAQAEADMSIEDRMAEQQRLEDKYLGKDTATADYRKSIMEEKANAPDEARRQMGLRLMEFGANWAGTPGPPLVAGMRALKDTLPGVMEDTKENKKIMKEIDKSIYMLEHATRLEEAGKLEKAAAEKEKASAKVLALAEPLVNFAMKKQELDATIEHQRAIERLKEQEMGQTAAYQTAMLGKPSEAGMKQTAIADLIKQGKSPSEAYGIVESYGTATKDPTLGYRVAMAKTKLDAASDVYNSAIGEDSKQKALDKLQAATAEFENLQRQFDPTGVYGTVPAPSVGPRAGAGQNRIPLSSFQK